VKHLKRWTLFQMIRTDIFSRGIPWMRLLFQDNRSSGEIGDLNLKISGILSVILAWAGIAFLVMSFRSPKRVCGLCSAFGILFVLNWPIYRFFSRLRGPLFVLMIIPLHVLYHIYNGASVIGGLFYRCLIDKPLPGLRSIGITLKQFCHSIQQRQEDQS
jgi:hypothetical protein